MGWYRVRVSKNVEYELVVGTGRPASIGSTNVSLYYSVTVTTNSHNIAHPDHRRHRCCHYLKSILSL